MTEIHEWHGHHSLRFDADPDLVGEFVATVVLAFGLKLYTTTEGRNPRLVRAVRRALPKEYGVVRRFEYLIIWHRPTYRSHWLAFLAALDPRQFRMLGGHRMFRVARKRFTHRETGRPVRAEVAHAPSGVNAGDRIWNDREHPDRVRISKSGFERWGHRRDRYRHHHPDGVLAMHMDSNLNQFRAGWRHYLTQELHADGIWDLAGMPHHGTHGLQLIDTAHVVGIDVDRAAVVDRKRPPKLDHLPFIYRAVYP